MLLRFDTSMRTQFIIWFVTQRKNRYKLIAYIMRFLNGAFVKVIPSCLNLKCFK